MRLSPPGGPPWGRAEGSRVLPTVPSAARDAEPVIATKLFVPAPGTHAIDRPRLRGGLQQALHARLTVVVAPAGWGKTTLVAQWLQGADVVHGWLSLDAADDDVTRFWRYVLLAVRPADVGIGLGALRRLDAAGTDVERDVLPVLIDELIDAGRDVLLVLDDYHLVRDPSVHRSVTTLLDHAPECLHLVISSRTDPPLPLSRLRVAGELAEFRAGQLGFTADEAARLLGTAAVPDLSPRELHLLVDRTEGWAAGLQLAALRLAGRAGQQARGDFIERFTGADRHVVDYLGEEVLDAQRPELRDFLLQTSVLPRLCAPLADAVTGRDDAARMLEEVRRANLFLVALDDEGRWYRYHQLFRDLLSFELERSGRADQATLHGRAAEWLQAHGELGEAIGHAVAARDLGLAGELIARAWRGEFNLGHLQTVQSWLTALPPAQVAADARLTVAQVWLQMDSGRLEEAGSALAAAERAAADDGHVQVLQALHALKAGNVPLAARRVSQVHGRVTDPFVVTVQDLVAGVCALWSGETSEAAARLERAAAHAEDTDNRLASCYALGAHSLLSVLTGDLVSAETLLREADAVVAESLVHAHFVAMFPALAGARLAARRGSWGEARERATSAAGLAARGAGRVERAAALVTAAEAARHAGRAGGADAEQWLSRAGAVLRSCADPGPTVRDWFSRERRAQRVTGPAVGSPTERLTERELAVLALLPTASSQRELAASLFVSANTLKTHLQAIYRKLGAESRDDAVLRARSAGLL